MVLVSISFLQLVPHLSILVVLQCHQSGVQRQVKNKKDARRTVSKKTTCPFSISINYGTPSKDQLPYIDAIDLTHNHPMKKTSKKSTIGQPRIDNAILFLKDDQGLESAKVLAIAKYFHPYAQHLEAQVNEQFSLQPDNEGNDDSADSDDNGDNADSDDR